MKLNVYLISHPLVKNLSSQITYASSCNDILYQYYYGELNFLLIYEAIRKWIKIYNIYIHNPDFTKEIYPFGIKESYILLTDLGNCGDMISRVRLVLPDIDIKHVNFNTIENKYTDNDCLYNNIITIMKTQKIIVIKKFLNDYSILQLLDYLFLKRNIKAHQIRLICVACSSNVLEKIGEKYPNLNIYTTKIYN